MTPLDPEYFLHYITAGVHGLEEFPEVIPLLVHQLVTTFGMPEEKAEAIVNRWWEQRLSISANNTTDRVH